MINRTDANKISDFTRHQIKANSLRWSVPTNIPDGSLEVVIPNYNNEYVLEQVLDSIVNQAGWLPRIRIIDNCSSDKSWEYLSNYTSRHSGIIAERLPTNTGPHHTSNILIRSSNAKYVLFASGNDMFAYDTAFLEMYTILESDDDIIIVYGRNGRDGIYSEPINFSFSVPGKKLRRQLRLSDADCMNMATWLYTSSEPLWGLYRSTVPKLIPAQPSYGADHAYISLCAFYGGIYGIDKLTRLVDVEHRDAEKLRHSQLQKTYTESQRMAALPIDSTNMIALCYTYTLSIKKSFLADSIKEHLNECTLNILFHRFFHHISFEYSQIMYHHRSGDCKYGSALSTLEAEEQMAYIRIFIRPLLIIFNKVIFLSKLSTEVL
jgi:glycosyltransferase involved in cell wall biosynthesis